MERKLAFTIVEAAKQSATGRTAIYGAINRGELVPRKRGSRTLILAADLNAWLEDLPQFATSNNRGCLNDASLEADHMPRGTTAQSGRPQRNKRRSVSPPIGDPDPGTTALQTCLNDEYSDDPQDESNA